MTEAKAAIRDYLERHDKIGGGSGRVWDHQGEVVARFSYNLRCWSPDGVRGVRVG